MSDTAHAYDYCMSKINLTTCCLGSNISNQRLDSVVFHLMFRWFVFQASLMRDISHTGPGEQHTRETSPHQRHKRYTVSYTISYTAANITLKLYWNILEPNRNNCMNSGSRLTRLLNRSLIMLGVVFMCDQLCMGHRKGNSIRGIKITVKSQSTNRIACCGGTRSHKHTMVATSVDIQTNAK